MRSIYIAFSIFYTLTSMEIHSTESNYAQEKENEKFQQTPKAERDHSFLAAFENFEKNKLLIHDCLSSLKEAELHFFWTTGRIISDNLEYQPDTKVDIGGSKYGNKFFPYVEKLLENSPHTLKVKFVCDTMTQTHNRSHFKELENKYGIRFEILPIERVQENILKSFPAAHQQQKINTLFKNATQGSPVIASDVYRIIGMVYGHTQSADVAQIQYTYCDVDEFCYGMEHRDNEKFIEALFRTNTKSPFYFGRSPTNNDIIKLQITDITSYKEFCDRMLNKINIHSVAIDHFTGLHDKIKLCEEVSNSSLNIESLVPYPVKNLILEVTHTTGPIFLGDRAISTDLSYPDETIGEWYAREEILDHTNSRYACAHPASVLDWGYSTQTHEQKQASQLFNQECDEYRKFISAAMYSKRFGRKHPFNLMIKEYLIKHFPYNSSSFKQLLKLNFESRHRDVKQDYKLNLMKRLPEDSKDYKAGNVYLNKEDDKLKYILISSSKESLDGQLDIDIKEKLTPSCLNKHKSEILQKLSEQGHTREPKKGLSYEEWKNETYNYLIEFSGNPTYGGARHYVRLTYLLKELEIEIPLTEKLFEIIQ
ncbi:MAG: hypothetical protein JNK42_05385 [Caedimonas sp.]|nr:hypothetical protein [Caedimonas sp.]